MAKFSIRNKDGQLPNLITSNMKSFTGVFTELCGDIFILTNSTTFYYSSKSFPEEGDKIYIRKSSSEYEVVLNGLIGLYKINENNYSRYQYISIVDGKVNEVIYEHDCINKNKR